MRLANLDGRAVVLVGSGAVDVARASDGRFGPSLASCYDTWEAFVEWASGVEGGTTPVDFDPTSLGSPSPTPRQVLAIGMNYAGHAAEVGVANPEFPPTFTKFVSCITGPYATVTLPTNNGIDWEVELCVVIGRAAHDVAAADAWSHVAGLTIGQDLSYREVQVRPPAPQFSLGKSFPGFGPMGPWLVTIDEFEENPDDLALSCTIDGETMQSSRTGDLIFSVPALIELLSGIVTLLPGDVIFTGTPAGVGNARTPKRFLKPGEVLVSTIEGIGSIVNNFVEA